MKRFCGWISGCLERPGALALVLLAWAAWEFGCLVGTPVPPTTPGQVFAWQPAAATIVFCAVMFVLGWLEARMSARRQLTQGERDEAILASLKSRMNRACAGEAVPLSPDEMRALQRYWRSGGTSL